MGVGRGGSTLKQCEQWSMQALDLALGRGGDQVAIKNNDDWRLKAMTLDMEIKDMKKREREKGKQEGLKAGKQERTLEIAKAMLADGMEISKVAKLTNLSVKEVTALA